MKLINQNFLKTLVFFLVLSIRIYAESSCNNSFQKVNLELLKQDKLENEILFYKEYLKSVEEIFKNSKTQLPKSVKLISKEGMKDSYDFRSNTIFITSHKLYGKSPLVILLHEWGHSIFHKNVKYPSHLDSKQILFAEYATLGLHKDLFENLIVNSQQIDKLKNDYESFRKEHLLYLGLNELFADTISVLISENPRAISDFYFNKTIPREDQIRHLARNFARNNEYRISLNLLKNYHPYSEVNLVRSHIWYNYLSKVEYMSQKSKVLDAMVLFAQQAILRTEEWYLPGVGMKIPRRKVENQPSIKKNKVLIEILDDAFSQIFLK